MAIGEKDFVSPLYKDLNSLAKFFDDQNLEMSPLPVLELETFLAGPP